MLSEDAARTFVLAEGRLLERRLLEVVFDGAAPEGVIAAVGAYRNRDGGFGHAMEPDLRCPGSQPIFAEQALRAYDVIGEAPEEVLHRLCSHLAASGYVGLPLINVSALEHPHASHWSPDATAPSLNPTAALCALMRRFGIDHPWVHDAITWCIDVLEEEGMPEDAHALRCVLTLLEHVPELGPLVPDAAEALGTASWFRHDPDDPGYGLTPLHFAPTPQSRWRELFADDLVERSLDRLERDQQADGGWPLTWEPPSQAAVLEWRGHETLRALRWLDAYGRLPDTAG